MAGPNAMVIIVAPGRTIEGVDRLTGWLGALGDGSIGAALRAMHADVAHRLTLTELADLARDALRRNTPDQTICAATGACR